jgi:hypothetical protein
MGWALVLLGSVALAPAGDASEAVPPVKPPWQRLLQGDDAHKAARLQERLICLVEAHRFAEALQLADQLEDLRRRT